MRASDGAAVSAPVGTGRPIDRRLLPTVEQTGASEWLLRIATSREQESFSAHDEPPGKRLTRRRLSPPFSRSRGGGASPTDSDLRFL